MSRVSRTTMAVLAGVLLVACQNDAGVDSPIGLKSADLQPELHLTGPGVIKKSYTLEYPEAHRFISKGFGTDEGRCRYLPRQLPSGKPYMEVHAEVNPETCETLVIVLDLPSDYQPPAPRKGTAYLVGELVNDSSVPDTIMALLEASRQRTIARYEQIQ